MLSFSVFLAWLIILKLMKTLLVSQAYVFELWRAFQKKAWACVGIWPSLGPSPNPSLYDVTYGFCSFIIDLVSVVYSLLLQLDQLRVKIVVTYKTLIFLLHMDQQLQFHLQLLNVHLVCFLNLQNFRGGVELGYSHEFETWAMMSFT